MRSLHSARWLLLALLICLIPASSQAGIFISVNFGPPVLPVYVQPPCPQPNLMWMPGSWQYGPDGYFWVPGAWVPAPYEGALWTPGYWGFNSGAYVWNVGYWGRHIGYYGGVNYGFGYGGIGFAGGEWRGHDFAYNTAVINVNTTIIHTTYVNETIVRQNIVANPNHVAYAGGPGGINHPASPQEKTFSAEPHTPPTSFQTQHVEAAKVDKTSYAKTNGGHPAKLVAAKPLAAETHAPPPMRAAVTPAKSTVGGPTGSVKPTTAAHPETNGTSARPATVGSQPKSPPANAMHTNTAPAHNTEAPRHDAVPPAHNTAPPVHNSAPKPPPPAPRPAAKPKPEGHEK
jgi:hypothetical protein